MTVEHKRYLVHLATECEGDTGNVWCRTCEELCLLADAADWRVIRIALTPEPDVADQVRRFEPATVG